MLQKKNNNALKIGGYKIPEIRYADDTVLLSTSQSGLENLNRSVQQHSEVENLYLNAAKTKRMPTDKLYLVNDISVYDQKLEVVTNFEYLGSLITNNGDTIKEINRRTSSALQKLKQLKKLWGRIDGTTKIRFFRACIFFIATYSLHGG
jgi:hypothetical protein